MPDAPVTSHPTAESFVPLLPLQMSGTLMQLWCSNYDGQYMLNAGLTEKITNEAARTQNSTARTEDIVQ